MRWLGFGLGVVLTVVVLAVISLGIVLSLQLLFSDWWTVFAVVMAALVVVLFLVTVALALLPHSAPAPLGALAVDHRGVTVHVVRRSGDIVERLEHPIAQVKTWTVDSAGNLTVWSPDVAEATYPAGSWERIERKA